MLRYIQIFPTDEGKKIFAAPHSKKKLKRIKKQDKQDFLLLPYTTPLGPFSEDFFFTLWDASINKHIIFYDTSEFIVKKVAVRQQRCKV